MISIIDHDHDHDHDIVHVQCHDIVAQALGRRHRFNLIHILLHGVNTGSRLAGAGRVTMATGNDHDINLHVSICQQTMHSCQLLIKFVTVSLIGTMQSGIAPASLRNFAIYSAVLLPPAFPTIQNDH